MYKKKKQKLDLNEFNDEKIILHSFPLFYFVIAGIFIIIGIFNYIIFGVESGRYPIRGAALMFQGPSYFSISGFPQILFGFGLLMRCFYIFFAPKYFFHLILEYDNEEKLLIMNERKFKKQKTTKVNLERFSNNTLKNTNYLGKIILLFIGVLFLFYYINQGVSNLQLSQIDGLPITGISLIITGVFSFILLILFILSQPYEIYLSDGSNYYQIMIYTNKSSKLRSDFVNKLNEINLNLEINIIKNSYKKKSSKIKLWISLFLILFGLANIIFLHTEISYIGYISSFLSFFIGLNVLLQLNNYSNLIRILEYFLLIWSFWVIVRLILPYFGDNSFYDIIYLRRTFISLISNLIPIFLVSFLFIKKWNKD